MTPTGLCQRLGIEVPILSAGLGGGIAGPELVAAVSNAGGLGVLGTIGLPPPYIRQQIHRTRELTTKPFGMNVVLAVLEGGELEVCFEERVPVLVLFWGDPSAPVAEAHRRGTKVIVQVGSVDEARAAARAGVDAIIAQGVEAGGHVRSTVSLATLVPAVVEAVKPLPVIAAGGIADGRGLVSALGLGAQAISMGTRFLCSAEAAAASAYKERVARSTADDTVLTELFDIGWPDAPHRVLRNKAVIEWERAGRPPTGHRPGEGTIVGRVALAGTTLEIPRYSMAAPLPGFEGDLEYAALYAGESCTLVHDIRPAAEIVREVMREADDVMARQRR